METAAIKASGSNKYTPFTRKLTAVYTRATLEVRPMTQALSPDTILVTVTLTAWYSSAIFAMRSSAALPYQSECPAFCGDEDAMRIDNHAQQSCTTGEFIDVTDLRMLTAVGASLQ